MSAMWRKRANLDYKLVASRNSDGCTYFECRQNDMAYKALVVVEFFGISSRNVDEYCAELRHMAKRLPEEVTKQEAILEEKNRQLAEMVKRLRMTLRESTLELSDAHRVATMLAQELSRDDVPL